MIDVNVCVLLTVMAQYTQLVGRLEVLPPKHALGIWYHPNSSSQQYQVSLAKQFVQHRIPLDSFTVWDEWTHKYPTSFLWDASFPDPAAYYHNLQPLNVSVHLWEHTYVHHTAPFYAELLNKNLTANFSTFGTGVDAGLTPDWAMPETQKIFANHHMAKIVLNKQVFTGFKLDENDGNPGWYFSDDTRFPSGYWGYEMHNAYGMLNNAGMHKTLKDNGIRGYTLSRGNYAGTQRYPTGSYSDTYGMAEYTEAVAAAGFFGGLGWAPELQNWQSFDDFARRVELMMLAPISGWDAWDCKGVFCAPWLGGAQFEDHFRKYAELRLSLLPYHFTGYRTLQTQGLPFIQPLALEYAKLPLVRNVSDQFFFGDLLVAPVTNASAISRSVTLPPGVWHDYWENGKKSFTSPPLGSVVTYPAPVGMLPLFVRDNSIIAMLPRGQRNIGDTMDEPVLEAHLWTSDIASANASFVVYEDDGVSLQYMSGCFIELELTARPKWRLVAELSAAAAAAAGGDHAESSDDEEAEARERRGESVGGSDEDEDED